MKFLVGILSVAVATALAEPITITLAPNDDTLNLEYGHQILEKFDAIRESNPTIALQFAKFEDPSKEAAGGRYMGASGTPFTLHESVDVDFRDDGGTRDYKQTIVLFTHSKKVTTKECKRIVEFLQYSILSDTKILKTSAEIHLLLRIM